LIGEVRGLWFDVDPRSDVPIYQQLVAGVKSAVARGILLPGEKLPSVRELAGRIAINPNTIAKAYQELEREGIIETLRGRGTFVADAMSGDGDGESRRRQIRRLMEQVLVEAHYLWMEEEALLEWLEEIVRQWYAERRKPGASGDRDPKSDEGV
jgi:GntR family transcriptional regulator